MSRFFSRFTVQICVDDEKNLGTFSVQISVLGERKIWTHFMRESRLTEMVEGFQLRYIRYYSTTHLARCVAYIMIMEIDVCF